MISSTARAAAVAQMNTQTRPGASSFVIGSVAMGLIVAGGAVFVQQLVRWAREHEWVTVTLRSIVRDDLGKTPVPSMLMAIQRWNTDVHGLVIQAMDAVPLWMLLVLVGGVVAVRVGKVGS
jgi:hypothetical protein